MNSHDVGMDSQIHFSQSIFLQKIYSQQIQKCYQRQPQVLKFNFKFFISQERNRKILIISACLYFH